MYHNKRLGGGPEYQTIRLYVKQFFFGHGSTVLVGLELLYEVSRSQSGENATLGRTADE